MFFEQFCMNVASDIHITEPLNDVSQVPSYDIQSRVHNLIKQLVYKMDILDHVHVWYVENALSDMTEVEEKLKSFNNGDVPDWVINELSTNLYRQSFQELNKNQQSIIKTLAVYICISGKGN